MGVGRVWLWGDVVGEEGRGSWRWLMLMVVAGGVYLRD